MKKKSTMFLMVLGAAMLTTSCLSEQQDLAPKNEESKMGKIVIDLSADASFNVQTRALSEAAYRSTDNYQVQIFNNDNPTSLLVDCKYSELDGEMPSSFQPGTYTVKAFYGTEHNYSRNEFYVEGIKNNVTVNAGDKASVALTCLPTCGKISVEFDAAMSTYYDSYDVEFSQAIAFAGSSIAWNATDNEPWYVKLGVDGESLRYTINLTAKDEYAYTDNQGNKKTTGTVTNEFTLQRNRAYKLKIKPEYTPTAEGGLTVVIEIDESTNPIDIPVVVPIDWL